MSVTDLVILAVFLAVGWYFVATVWLALMVLGFLYRNS